MTRRDSWAVARLGAFSARPTGWRGEGGKEGSWAGKNEKRGGRREDGPWENRKGRPAGPK